MKGSLSLVEGLRGDEYSKIESTPCERVGGLNEKHIMTGVRYPETSVEEVAGEGDSRRDGRGLNAIICVGGRTWPETINPPPFNYA